MGKSKFCWNISIQIAICYWMNFQSSVKNFPNTVPRINSLYIISWTLDGTMYIRMRSTNLYSWSDYHGNITWDGSTSCIPVTSSNYSQCIVIWLKHSTTRKIHIARISMNWDSVLLHASLHSRVFHPWVLIKQLTLSLHVEQKCSWVFYS